MKKSTSRPSKPRLASRERAINVLALQKIEKPDDDRFGKKISLGLYHLYKNDLQNVLS